MTTNTLIDIYNGQPGVTDTTLYTSAANTRTRVLAATVTNDTTSAIYISFHRVPSGGSVSDANIIVNQRIIGSRETATLYELIGHVVEAGGFLSAIAEVAAQLTVHISGVKIT